MMRPGSADRYAATERVAFALDRERRELRRTAGYRARALSALCALQSVEAFSGAASFGSCAWIAWVAGAVCALAALAWGVIAAGERGPA